MNKKSRARAKQDLSDADRRLIEQFYSMLEPMEKILEDDLNGLLSPKNSQLKALLGSSRTFLEFGNMNKQQLLQKSSALLKQIGFPPLQMSETPTPKEEVQRVLTIVEKGVDPKRKDEFRQSGLKTQLPFILAFSHIRSEIRCLTMFGINLESMLELAKDNDEAVFRAVLANSNVVNHPTISEKIRAAEALNDSDFLEEIAKSIAKSKARRHKRLDDMRFMIAFVDLIFKIETISDNSLVQVFQTDLGLIGEPGGDSLDAIKLQIRAWKGSQEGEFKI